MANGCDRCFDKSPSTPRKCTRFRYSSVKDARHALMKQLGSILTGLATLAEFLLDGFRRSFAFQGSAVVVWGLVASPQGQELARISNESPRTLGDTAMLGCIPLLFSVATAFASRLWPNDAERLSMSGRRIPSQACLRLVALMAISLPVPAILFGAVQWEWVYAAYVFAGVTLILCIGLMRNTRRRVAIGIVTFSLLLGYCVLLLASPGGAARVGTIGVTVVAFAFWSSLLTILALTTPWTLRPFPGLRLAYLVLVVCAVTWALFALPPLTPEREAVGQYREPVREGWQPDYSPVQAYFLDWLEARAANIPRGQPIPVFLVAAEGGGLRAAAWTSALLNSLDEDSDGKFFEHLFAVSGVSGGAVGVAYYTECRLLPASLGKCGSAPLQRDFLAPAVARLLLVEPFRLVPFLRTALFPRDRSFESNLSRNSVTSAPIGRINQPMNEVFKIDSSATSPIVTLNTTDAHSGRRVYFSNIDLQIADAMHAHMGVNPASSVPLSFAMHTSARFPLVSPPAVYGGWVLVDGGYRENIGLAEIEAVLHAIQRVIVFAEQKPEEVPPVYTDYSFSEKETRNDARTLFEYHKRARRLLPLLRLVQVHVLAVTNSQYTNVKPHEYPEVLGIAARTEASPWDDLLAPVNAILAARVSRTKDSIRRMSAELELPAITESEACTQQLTKAAERLGKPGTAGFFAARQFHHEENSAPCDVFVPRHTLVEYSLQYQMDAELPALGWVLSAKSHNAIQAASQASVRGDFGRTPWFEQLIGNLCGGVETADIVGTVWFNESGKPVCEAPNARPR